MTHAQLFIRDAQKAERAISLGADTIHVGRAPDCAVHVDDVFA